MHVDSGATDAVMVKEIGSQFVVKETQSSKKGVGYIAANGSNVENYGERVVKGFTGEGCAVSMAMRVAGVKRTLGSV